MKENQNAAEAKDVKAQQTPKDHQPTAKGLQEKITEALNKDDDLLTKIVKAVSNPLVLLLLIPVLLYYLSKQQQLQQAPPTVIKKEGDAATKLKKKNKRLKKKLTQQFLMSKVNTQKATAFIN